MKRAFLTRIAFVLVILGAVIVVGAGSASGSGGSVTRDWFHGPFAEAAWQTSPTAFGFTLVSREQNGTTHLSVHQITLDVDANGDVTGGVDVGGETTAGVSFAIDAVHYTAASTNSIVPLSRCTLDADGNTTGCQDAGTLSVAADWTGQGPIPHQPETFVTHGSCLAVDHSSTVERAASATVLLGGVPVDPATMGFAGFGIGNGGLITVCPHS
jgi:hypothetical protein